MRTPTVSVIPGNHFSTYERKINQPFSDGNEIVITLSKSRPGADRRRGADRYIVGAVLGSGADGRSKSASEGGHVISAYMQELLEKIYADTNVFPAEIIELRNAADDAADKVFEHEGREGVLDATTKSFDVTNQSVQEVALRLKEDGYSDMGAAMVRAVIEAHIALLRATVRAFE